jgi:RNA polymerase sigma-70 factor (ECF subfamily)
MLWSVSDADDVVQVAFLRWHGADVSGMAEPRAFLMRVTTRLCLDHLKSARVRRESYVGVWLPLNATNRVM